MKKILLLNFILVSLTCISQNLVIPENEWHGNEEKENVFLKLLNLKNENSIIVKFGFSSYWTKGTVSNFIVYENGGKVKRYEVFESYNTEKKIKIKRRRVKKKEFKHYWNYFSESITDGKLKIDQSKLNITEKKGTEEGTRESMMVSDGANYHFWIRQNKKYIAYGSYAPNSYINGKYPGYKERQKLVDLINGFEKLIEKY